MNNLIYLFYAVAILLFLKEVLISKHIANSLIALNSINTIIATLIVLTGFLFKEDSYIDVAIIYILLGYVTNIGFLKKYKNNQNE